MATVGRQRRKEGWREGAPYRSWRRRFGLTFWIRGWAVSHLNFMSLSIICSIYQRPLDFSSSRPHFPVSQQGTAYWRNYGLKSQGLIDLFITEKDIYTIKIALVSVEYVLWRTYIVRVSGWKNHCNWKLQWIVEILLLVILARGESLTNPNSAYLLCPPAGIRENTFHPISYLKSMQVSINIIYIHIYTYTVVGNYCCWWSEKVSIAPVDRWITGY